jgi:hypothetical protein
MLWGCNRNILPPVLDLLMVCQFLAVLQIYLFNPMINSLRIIYELGPLFYSEAMQELAQEGQPWNRSLHSDWLLARYLKSYTIILYAFISQSPWDIVRYKYRSHITSAKVLTIPYWQVQLLPSLPEFRGALSSHVTVSHCGIKNIHSFLVHIKSVEIRATRAHLTWARSGSGLLQTCKENLQSPQLTVLLGTYCSHPQNSTKSNWYIGGIQVWLTYHTARISPRSH